MDVCNTSWANSTIEAIASDEEDEDEEAIIPNDEDDEDYEENDDEEQIANVSEDKPTTETNSELSNIKIDVVKLDN